MPHQNSPVTPDRRSPDQIVDPPHSLGAIIRQIGPGLIIAANIVGSGELIMTTKTGAQAGISLLWLILLGCVVKVFVQLEFGRFAISHGETTLTSLNRVPGPKFLGINWIVAFWAIMISASTGQLGGILGGVSQSVSITFPITGDYQAAVQVPAEQDLRDHAAWKNGDANSEKAARRLQRIEEELAELGERGKILLDLSMAGKDLVDQQGNSLVDPKTIDDKIWAILIGLATAAILFVGRYSLIEVFSVALVVAFTFITVGNVALQGTTYAISGQDFLYGLSFHLPDTGDWNAALVTAFATFGIIGVGATELISYPYWCLEKGYARSAGPRTMDESWVRRGSRLVSCDEVGCLYVHGYLYGGNCGVLSNGCGRAACRRTQSRRHAHGEHVGSQLCADLRRICEVVVPVRSGGGAVFDISCRQRGQCPHDRRLFRSGWLEFKRCRQSHAPHHGARNFHLSPCPVYCAVPCVSKTHDVDHDFGYDPISNAPNAGFRRPLFSLL